MYACFTTFSDVLLLRHLWALIAISEYDELIKTTHVAIGAVGDRGTPHTSDESGHSTTGFVSGGVKESHSSPAKPENSENSSTLSAALGRSGNGKLHHASCCQKNRWPRVELSGSPTYAFKPIFTVNETSDVILAHFIQKTGSQHAKTPVSVKADMMIRECFARTLNYNFSTLLFANVCEIGQLFGWQNSSKAQ